MPGDELFNEHPIEGDAIGTCCRRFQLRKGRAAREFAVPANGCLHEWVVTQAVVVVDVFVAAAQPIEPLGNEIAQGMGDARRIALVVEYIGRCPAQTDLPIHFSQQQETTARTDGASRKISFDKPASKLLKDHPISGTLWHRRNSSLIRLRHLY